MTEPFNVPVAVRGYELDVNGHLNWANYLHYAEHARWECLRAAGLTYPVLDGAGLGPVNLEANVRPVTARAARRRGDNGQLRVPVGR